VLTILSVVFGAAFLIAVLLLWAGAAERSKQSQAAQRRLDSLVSAAPVAAEEVVDLRKQERLSTLPWLDRWLAQVNIIRPLRLLLYQADLQWSAESLILSSVGCWAAGSFLLYLRTGAGLLAMIGGLAAAAIPGAYVWHKRSQRFLAIEKLLPPALDMMVGALRAGHSLTSAIGMIGREMAPPISTEFRKCYDEQMFGIETRTAMLNFVARVPMQPLRIIATAILIQKESGGNLAEVLEKAAYVIRERFQLQRQISVHTAQGRLTGWILALLPVVLGFLLYLIRPEHFSLLWKRPAGLRMLYGSVIMTILGTLIIRKIVRIRV